MYKSNPRNDDFIDLSFDGDQRLIPKRQLYSVKYDIVLRLKNSLIVDIYTNWMK